SFLFVFQYDTPPKDSIPYSRKIQNKDVGFPTYLYVIFPTSLLYHLHMSKVADLTLSLEYSNGAVKLDGDTGSLNMKI
ncbi:MAG: hypothetical protein MSH15_12665, partial [Oscillospiraceae bacterium]|nr:hypothetical protein [Oscillospiraceae bacterium]